MPVASIGLAMAGEEGLSWEEALKSPQALNH